MFSLQKCQNIILIALASIMVTLNNLVFFNDWPIYGLKPQTCKQVVFITYSSYELNVPNLILKSLISLNDVDKSV